MKNLFDKETEQEVINRINSLTPESQKQWGKMQVDQMLAHCSASFRVAVGETNPPRIFLGRIIGSMLKSEAYSDKAMPKNSPTDKSFIIADRRNFEEEKAKLLALVRQFSEGGVAKCTTHPHSFFGSLTAEQWGMNMYKHIDHHLMQFSA
jgi:hypothetical protein